MSGGPAAGTLDDRPNTRKPATPGTVAPTRATRPRCAMHGAVPADERPGGRPGRARPWRVPDPSTRLGPAGTIPGRADPAGRTLASPPASAPASARAGHPPARGRGRLRRPPAGQRPCSPGRRRRRAARGCRRAAAGGHKSPAQAVGNCSRTMQSWLPNMAQSVPTGPAVRNVSRRSRPASTRCVPVRRRGPVQPESSAMARWAVVWKSSAYKSSIPAISPTRWGGRNQLCGPAPGLSTAATRTNQRIALMPVSLVARASTPSRHPDPVPSPSRPDREPGQPLANTVKEVCIDYIN
jgi:hypothetical protein